MANPWEKYQSTPAEEERPPWERFSAPEEVVVEEEVVEEIPGRDPRYLYNENGTVAGINPDAVEETNIDDVRGGLQSFLQGQLYGAGDEIVGLGRAVAESILPETEADRIAREITGGEGEQSFGDRYAMYRDDERANLERFRDENTGAALVGEIAGGLASPGMAVAALRNLGTTGSALSRAGQMAGVGAAEGALYGLGSGEGDIADRLENAASTALIGGATGGALSGLGGVAGRGLTKARVSAEDLYRDGVQRPLTALLPEESLAGKVYNLAADSFGGEGLRRQGVQDAATNPRLAQFADESGNVIDPHQTGKAALEGATQRIDDQARLATDTLNREIKDSAYTTPTQTQTEAVTEGLAQSRMKMRQDQARAAVPDHAPDELKAVVENETDPAKVARALDNWWQKEGFKGVKDHKFKVDTKLHNFLKKHIDSDDPLWEVLDEALEEGRPVSGKWLMDLRNNPARESGRAGDYTRGRLRKDVEGFDKQIERLLKEDGNTPALQQFRTEKNMYGDKQAYVNAVDKAQAGGKGTAEFTEDHLYKSAPKRRRRYGDAPGQDRARTVIEEREGLKQATKAARAAEKEQSKAKQSYLRNRKRRVEQRQRAAHNRLARETENLVPRKTTFWSRLANTAGLGALPSAFTVAGSVPAGMAMASGLGTQAAQRAVAGQTAMQTALREAMERGDTAAVTRILMRLSAMESAQE